MKSDDYAFLLKVLSQNAGWEFNNDHYFVLDKKASNFVREKGYLNTDEFIADLRTGNKLLTEQVVEDMSFSDTSFYRDYDVFKRFSQNVLPHLKDSYRSVKKLNIWSCGCSTGQEVYSILMCLKQNGFVPDWDISITGTDISSRSLNVAQKGLYSSVDAQNGLNIRTIVDNFTYVENYALWQVNKDLLDRAEFRKYNLLDDIIFSQFFDIVFCRNVLQYFKSDLQLAIVQRLHKAQPTGGLLYLSLNEQIVGIEQFYEKVVGFECLYQAKALAKSSKDEFVNEFKGDHMPKFVRPDNLVKKL